MKNYFSPRVLIVDDEVDTCYLLLSILKSKQISTQCINSLYEVEEVVKKSEPNIVFLDNHLQDGNGIDFIDTLKKYAPESKIVIITAQDNAENRNKATKNGADFFISKPFKKDNIYQVIDLLNVTKKPL